MATQAAHDKVGIVAIDDLAHDELKYILSYCDGQSILNCLKVCKLWREFSLPIPVSIEFKSNSQFSNVKKNVKTISTMGINFNLTGLNLSGFKGGEMIISELRKIHYFKTGKLKSLNLGEGIPFKNERIDDELLENLESLSVGCRYEFSECIQQVLLPNLNNQLTSLDLSNNYGLDTIFTSNIVKNLKVLKINDCGIVSLDLENPLPNLTELHLNNNIRLNYINIGDKLSNLKVLNLHRAGEYVLFNDLSLQNAKLDQLTELDIGCSKCNDSIFIKILENLPKLKKLVLFGTPSSDMICQFISENNELFKNLQSLNLGRTFCSFNSINFLAKSSLKLCRLILDNIKLNEESCKVLSENEKVFGNLTDLSLSYCELTAECLKYLTNSPTLSKLQELQLKSNPIGSEGCTYLATSKFITRLTYLNLCNTQLEEDNCSTLANSTNFTRITELDISGNDNVFDFEIIQKSQNFPNLQLLEYKHNFFEDQSMSRKHQVNNK